MYERYIGHSMDSMYSMNSLESLDSMDSMSGMVSMDSPNLDLRGKDLELLNRHVNDEILILSYILVILIGFVFIG